jgi:LemA protein
MGPASIVAAAVVLLLLLIVAAMYNSLVRLRNHCDEAWSNVETELQRRYDLIPNLVSTVKGYAKHERNLLEEVTRLRGECATNRGTPKEQAATENAFGAILGRLWARFEAYPDLKADRNFLELQQELIDTEDRIQAANRFYNGNVRENNNKVQTVPSNLIAALFGFKEREFFELRDEAARSAPRVNL